MTDSHHSIQQVDDLFQFFRSELSEAFDKLGLTPREETQTYLVHLLESFARLDERSREALGFQRPAAFILGDALQSDGDRRIEAYRRLGDASLFSCGFFREYLDRNRSVVAVDYYRSMGRNAYAHLESLMQFKAPGGAFHVIYDELTDQFDTIVEAFRVLAGSDESPTCAQLVDRWKKQGTIDVEAWSDVDGFPGIDDGEA